MQKAIANADHPAQPNRAGARAFRWSRVTAVLLVFLVPYALYVLASAAGSDVAGSRHVLAAPLNSLGLLALIGIGVWHMWLGMREILEDYVRGPTLKAFLTANTLFCLAIVLAAGGSVLKLWLGA